MYLTLKLIHIFLIISWFAGLFYLPRIFVNLASVDKQSPEYDRLLGMAQRLYRFMAPMGYLALLFGVIIVFHTFAWTGSGNYWTHPKTLLGIFLLGYQHICKFHLKKFAQRNNTKSHKFFRIFNEIPVFLLLIELYLVLFKPF